MYLILTKAKGSIPQSWCTCGDADVNSALLDLIATGYGKDDDIYTLYIPDAESLPQSNSLTILPLSSGIGIHPFNMAQRSEPQEEIFSVSPALDPAINLPTEDIAETPLSQSSEDTAEDESLSQTPHLLSEAEAEEAELNFVSETTARFSYLDRLTPREIKTEAKAAKVAEKEAKKKAKNRRLPFTLRAKEGSAPIPLQGFNRTVVCEDEHL